MTLHENNSAPEFSLFDQDNKKWSLTDFKDEWLVVYFYPKDDTPGCTKEACEMRDNLTSFNRMKLKVVGISTDSVTSHQKFAKKYNLTFPLLSDENRQVVKAYDVWKDKKFMGKTYQGIERTSFLINPEGKIAKIFSKVNPVGHAAEVLEAAKESMLQ